MAKTYFTHHCFIDQIFLSLCHDRYVYLICATNHYSQNFKKLSREKLRKSPVSGFHHFLFIIRILGEVREILF